MSATATPSIAESAQTYLDADLCVLPAIRAEKRPAIGAWKPYQERLPTADESSQWFTKPRDALCILCGLVSGDVECIDFDDAEAFKRWLAKIPDALRDRLVIERTPSGGYHVIYRCVLPVCGNIKLAQRKVDGKIITLIETRGEGGLFLCAPTACYEIIEGDIGNLPTLTEDERETLLQTAWALSEYEPTPVGGRCANGYTATTQRPVSPPCGDPTNSRPGDDFNARGDVRAVLKRHGWALVRSGENEHWRRPGKQAGTSATLKNDVFYVFSFNAAPFEPMRGYGPFGVYTMLEHAGNFEAAAKALAKAGYGDQRPALAVGGGELSGITGQFESGEPLRNPYKFDGNAGSNEPYEPMFVRIGTLEMTRPDWLLRGTLERDTFAMMFGDPGCGKSFLAIDWACRIATGTPWRDYEVKPGTVAYIAGEGQQGLVRRFRAWERHHGVNIDDAPIFKAASIGMTDLSQAGRLITAIEKELTRPALVVLDTLARNFGAGDENSTQDMSRFVAACDAVRHRFGCTVLVVHHTGHAEKTRARGAMALKAALDAEYRLERIGDGVRLLTATKMKEAEEPAPISFQLESVELDGLLDDFGNPVTSAAVDLIDPNTDAVMAKSAQKPPATGRGKWQRLGLQIADQLAAQSRHGRVEVEHWHAACEQAGMPKQRRYEVAAQLPIEDGFILAQEACIRV